MSNQNTQQQSQTSMKQKLLKILQEKNNKPIAEQKQRSNLDYSSLQRKLSQPSHKLPVEMNKSAREIWLFEIFNNQNLTQKNSQINQKLSNQRDKMEQQKSSLIIRG
ncbi:unnamed protein product [Paramecium octaurelia]|uniref:Uncharacterized protein n=1 Tax=Paramecium octaurelia TaxID=43137 RepID=A0A8S1V7H3_PAROT|nr:unnamed protein product [Paramecium octaurelia]